MCANKVDLTVAPFSSHLSLSSSSLFNLKIEQDEIEEDDEKRAVCHEERRKKGERRYPDTARVSFPLPYLGHAAEGWVPKRFSFVLFA